MGWTEPVRQAQGKGRFAPRATGWLWVKATAFGEEMTEFGQTPPNMGVCSVLRNRPTVRLTSTFVYLMYGADHFSLCLAAICITQLGTVRDVREGLDRAAASPDRLRKRGSFTKARRA